MRGQSSCAIFVYGCLVATAMHVLLASATGRFEKLITCIPDGPIFRTWYIPVVGISLFVGLSVCINSIFFRGIAKCLGSKKILFLLGFSAVFDSNLPVLIYANTSRLVWQYGSYFVFCIGLCLCPRLVSVLNVPARFSVYGNGTHRAPGDVCRAKQDVSSQVHDNIEPYA